MCRALVNGGDCLFCFHEGYPLKDRPLGPGGVQTAGDWTPIAEDTWAFNPQLVLNGRRMGHRPPAIRRSTPTAPLRRMYVWMTVLLRVVPGVPAPQALCVGLLCGRRTSPRLLGSGFHCGLPFEERPRDQRSPANGRQLRPKFCSMSSPSDKPQRDVLLDGLKILLHVVCLL